jgi:hypothetical protein
MITLANHHITARLVLDLVCAERVMITLANHHITARLVLDLVCAE